MSFLTEFARLLLAAGFSNAQFSQIAELAFFRAASENAKFRNSRINQSSVAAMTGINRAKIRALVRAENKNTLPKADMRHQRLLTAWMSEPELLTTGGEPRRLPVAGSRTSFGALARRFGGDVPPKALLRDLVQRGHVRVSNGFVQIASDARELKELKRIEQISAALALSLCPPKGADSRRTVKVLSFEVSHPAPTAVERILLQRRITKSLGVFMADLEAACKAIATGDGSKTGKKRAGKTSVVLLNQD